MNVLPIDIQQYIYNLVKYEENYNNVIKEMKEIVNYTIEKYPKNSFIKQSDYSHLIVKGKKINCRYVYIETGNKICWGCNPNELLKFSMDKRRPWQHI